MKKSNSFIKPLAMVSIIGLSIFSCARTDTGRATTNTGNEPMAGTTTGTETMGGTTTGTQTSPTDQTTTGTGNETMTGGTTTDTQTTGGTTTGNQTMGGTTTGTQTQDQTGTMTQDQERLSNQVSYDEMFEDVDNTENYDVLALARMEENLSTFVELVEQAGLAQSFEAIDQPITVFAPTNEAFQEMSRERYEYLTNPENRAELMSVLQAHILPSEVSSVAFSDNQRIVDAEGNEIEVDTEMHGTAVFVGGAEIVRSDIAASNGIIHVVNGVIDPSQTPAGRGPYDTGNE